MFTRITKGIKVSVQTAFKNTIFKSCKRHYAFEYTVTIENLGKDVIQLMTRHWDIFDALEDMKVVEGNGVVGQVPKIKPGEFHTYSSGCVLSSPIGAMRGYYQVVNLSNIRAFRVEVPTFKLAAAFAMS